MKNTQGSEWETDLEQLPKNLSLTLEQLVIVKMIIREAISFSIKKERKMAATKNTQGSALRTEIRYLIESHVTAEGDGIVIESDLFNRIGSLVTSNNQALLQKAKLLLTIYDESPDDMAGHEIIIKKAVEFRTKLDELERAK